MQFLFDLPNTILTFIYDFVFCNVNNNNITILFRIDTNFVYTLDICIASVGVNDYISIRCNLHILARHKIDKIRVNKTYGVMICHACYNEPIDMSRNGLTRFVVDNYMPGSINVVSSSVISYI